MKPEMSSDEQRLRKQFDFSKAVRGKYFDRYQRGQKVHLLDQDPGDDDPLDPSTNLSTREMGRQFFESQIKAAGLRLEETQRDEGYDYLVYPRSDRNGGSAPFRVKLVTSANETFGLWKKSLRVPRSIIAYVWRARCPEESSVYALTYDEAFQIIRHKGYANTHAWKDLGGYSVVHAGSELKQMLAGFRMTPERWKERLSSI